MSPEHHLPSGWVTFVFTDIEGSTRLARMLGPVYRPVLHEHRRLLRDTLAGTDGAELLTEGDSFFLAFPDAAAAVHACLTAQRALAGHDWPNPDATPRVRMGLHTGYAEPRDGEYASPEVHRAARVAAAAHGGQVLCSAATAKHAEPLPDGVSLLDLGLHRLRGFDDRERLFQLVAPGLERRFPRPRTADAAAHNLPTQVTSFVGRQAERAELGRLVEAYRLVTVLGAGGAGKTRLAVELASGIVEDYPDGVWFVDIAAVTDPGLVAFEIAAVLGLRPEPGRPMLDTLVEYAAPRRMLVLLDTCDAQTAASAEVISRLLAGGRGVRVLATSRESFGVPGEVVWRIPPLSVDEGPDGGSDAVALLLDRTAVARGGRAPEAAEQADLHRVVRRLDGLPLAIELAAARLRVLSAGQLAERLDDMLGTLDAGRETAEPPPVEAGWSGNQQDTVDLVAAATGAAPPTPATRAVQRSASERHLTIQATVTWSYRTLGARSARLLRWMAVFAGPVDLPTVQWLLGEDPLDPLSVLVDKSMVLAEPHASGSTYRMLDPIRAYAARRLVEAGEEQSARDRHVDWCRHALDRACLGPDGRPVTLSLYALDPLAGELRAALRWCATGGSARAGLRLAGDLDQWWRERGLAREGRLWLFRLYGRLAETGEVMPEAELAAAYHMHSLHAGADGEFGEELRYSQRAEAAARQSGDRGLLARVLAGRAAPLVDMGQFAEAERVCREVIDWAYAQDVVGDALLAVYNLAELLWRRGALDEAAEVLAAARPVEASRPAERGGRSVDMLLGMVALARGDLVAAHEHLLVALRSRMSHGYLGRACDTINAIAVRCALAGDALSAARLFGAAQATRSNLRATPGIYGPYWAARQAELRRVLGDEAFDAAYGAGAGLRLDEVAALALHVEHPDLAADSPRFGVPAQGSWPAFQPRSTAG
ncbi:MULTISPECIES: ATP-binding protein [Micromonospora]|uniref:Adenylate/guanylate cyclase domain-containing protein n=2 Tax=Micromonospora TaxID=1873 RepID=A0ABX9XVH1_MICCH|nr:MULTISPECIES: adenylate/guanylate cyclase domain-containing protein [Micromonospora]MBC8994205.1 adenylate/guanylate cyclase domain-containing protein [Micromonospora chalcea]MBP1785822.1 putative ATPase [Micromonospora sp. HB375]MBQ1063297.1 adenylate/guanylate cyclase domain-containing protein [Micromonospora sp. C41]MCK1808059.1 adenylate/guanylate cyclase domain-containing protein [Micromonospora sp. R42106]MCK1832788.1 adenylate/guanylate cyclase domain-containing protein [Micromonospo